jgi:hypothetical protein
MSTRRNDHPTLAWPGKTPTTRREVLPLLLRELHNEPLDAAIGQKTHLETASGQIADFAPRARKAPLFAQEVYSYGTGAKRGA